MSTRSILIVTDNDSTTRLYKHSDGYPSDTLDVIYHALADSMKMLGAYNDENTWEKNKRGVSSDILVGKLIGHGTSAYGRGIRIEKEFGGPFQRSHLGGQMDLEYIYVIDTDKKTITVYGGKWIDKKPIHHLKNGPISEEKMPQDDRLVEDARASEVKTVRSLMKKIKSLGFTFVHTKAEKELVESSFLQKVDAKYKKAARQSYR